MSSTVLNFTKFSLQPHKIKILYVCVCVCARAQLLSHVQLLVSPWTVAHQASLSLGFFPKRILEWVAISFSRDLLIQRSTSPSSSVTCYRWPWETHWSFKSLDRSMIFPRSPIASYGRAWTDHVGIMSKFWSLTINKQEWMGGSKREEGGTKFNTENYN